MPVILNDVYVAEGRRVVRATVDGVSHEIPEWWMIEYAEDVAGANALDAARAWHQQKLAAELVGDGGRSNPDRFPENDFILGSRDVSHLEYGGQ